MVLDREALELSYAAGFQDAQEGLPRFSSMLGDTPEEVDSYEQGYLAASCLVLAFPDDGNDFAKD